MLSGTIFDIMKFSTRDGPGIRTTVFFKGCPLNCLWCHNPESQDSQPEVMLRPALCIACGECLERCPQGAVSRHNGSLHWQRSLCLRCGNCVEGCYAGARDLVGRSMTVGQVMAELERDVPFYDQSGGGVTLSGGEALAQAEFASALLQACRAAGIHTAVDTCGFVPWQVLEDALPFTDLFLYDLKLMDDERHRAATGASNVPILDNLRRLSARGVELRVRIPLVPGFNDEDDFAAAAGQFLAGLPRLDSVELLPYHPSGVEKYRRLGRDYLLPDLRAPAAERVEKIARMLTDFGLNVIIGG